MTAKTKPDAKAITSDQLEEMFDNGDDILDYVDMSNPVVEHHPPLEKRITLTMPAWMVGELDEEAADLAISRNAVVNTWIADRLRTTRRRETIHASPLNDEKPPSHTVSAVGSGALLCQALDARALRVLAPMTTPMVRATALMVVAAGSAHVQPHTGPRVCTSTPMAGSTISATHLSTS